MDKNTYKVVKYINRHSGKLSYDKVTKKFKNLTNPTFTNVMIWLLSNYLVALTDPFLKNSKGEPIAYENIYLTIQGKQEFEGVKAVKSGNIFAIITSLLALLVSIASYFKT